MHNSLELNINPFGQVTHPAIDTADDGTGFPFGFLVNLGSAVELWDPPDFIETALEVDLLCFWELFIISFD